MHVKATNGNKKLYLIMFLNDVLNGINDALKHNKCIQTSKTYLVSNFIRQQTITYIYMPRDFTGIVERRVVTK